MREPITLSEINAFLSGQVDLKINTWKEEKKKMMNVNDDIVKLQIAKNLLKEKIEDRNYFQSKLETEKEKSYSFRNPIEANLEDVLVEIQALEHFIKDVEDFLKEDAGQTAREQEIK